MTGDLLWQYSRHCRKASGPGEGNRLLRRQVFLGTSDMHVVALEVKTGDVAWDQAIEDSKKPVGS